MDQSLPSGSKSSAADTVADAETAAVQIRLPAFWGPESGLTPALWFAQAEAQFALGRVKEEQTRYYHVLAVLDTQTLREMADVIQAMDPAVPDPYTRLRRAMTERMTTSTERRIQQLLTAEEMGDRSPSSFLRHLRGLAGTDVKDALLQTIWSARLPPQIQAIISGVGEPLNQLAARADKIAEVLQPVQVAACSKVPPAETSLADQIATLTKAVERLQSRLDRQDAGGSKDRRRSHSRGPSKVRDNRSRSRTPKPNPDGHCYFHARFGADARKCRDPCTFASNK